MSLDADVLGQLKRHRDRGAAGREEYYLALTAAHDPYGAMALGVVRQANMAGRVAYSYAREVASRYCRPIDGPRWLQISTSLMESDFDARQDPDNFEIGPSLRYEVIRAYHRTVFENEAQLPPLAWTAWIPLLLDGESQDQTLWHRMLHEDFLVIGARVAWLAVRRISLREEIEREMREVVLPALTYSPPVVTGQRPADPAFDRCMARLAPYQLQGADASDRERLAVFYLDVLACSANLAGILELPMVDGMLAPDAAFHTVGPSYLPTIGDLERWSSRP